MVSAALVLVLQGLAAGDVLRGEKPAMAEVYLDRIITYSIHAQSLWHDGDVGGYWGGGVNDLQRDGNGAVRATCNTALGYAMLVMATDRGWISGEQQRRLRDAGLDRAALVRYIEQDLRYLAAHHVTASPRPSLAWGQSWQSSLWVGAAGAAGLIIWSDLPADVRDVLARISVAEADRIAANAPRDYAPGNTGAEENGWDTHALAIALSVDPTNASADKWWRALKAYAVNAYSVAADRQSDQAVGDDAIKNLVTTVNLFDDFTLENHQFFHPDYVQVSGAELGEALVYLALGDVIHGTHRADEFKPYAMHHVAEVWKQVLRPILLPDGNFAFPGGNDWTWNCSTNPTYLAFIATCLDDPVAAVAERRHGLHAQRRQALSPPGRLLGDSNLEWWWEPLLIKRSATALLLHAFFEGASATDTAARGLDTMFLMRTYPDSHIWIFRNTAYFVSASWNQPKMGTFHPFLGRDGEKPYMTLPINDGILPASIESLEKAWTTDEATVATFKLADGRRCAIVCLPHSVLWLSPEPLRGLGIENDPMSGGRRMITSSAGSTEVTALQPHEVFTVPAAWINIDNRLGLISAGDGWIYEPAGKFNRRSVAIDRVTPQNAFGAWQMISKIDSDQCVRAAKAFKADFNGQAMTVTCIDAGTPLRLTATLAGEVADGADLVTIGRN